MFWVAVRLRAKDVNGSMGLVSMVSTPPRIRLDGMEKG